MVRACCLLPACPALQPKVYSREGKELGEMPKGDMYIRDLKNTKGAAGFGGHGRVGLWSQSCPPAPLTPHSPTTGGALWWPPPPPSLTP